jgi:hypothetical protein
MSRTRWAFSLLLVWHLTAMGLGALPSPDKLSPIGDPRHPTDDLIAARVTPALDSGAARLVAVLESLSHITGPVRKLATVYLRTLGLSQNWSMFWEPPRGDLYARVRYYVRTTSVRETQGSPTWMATELVYPSTPEDQVRLFFRSQHRDKAIFSLLVNFERNRVENLNRLQSRPDELPTDLVPIARYFAKRFTRDHLQPGERILRTEVWSAIVANPPRGATLEPAVQNARMAALRAYYDGPIEQRLHVTPYKPSLATEGEADIVWVLQYFEES